MSTQTSQRQLDMLHGPIWNKIPQFALPVAATAILEQLFNASDVAVVGNFTGAESTLAVAAVGSNSSIISLIVNLFIGIALGSNVVIAHAIGHGDKASVHKAVHTSIVAAVLGGAAVTIIGELIAAPLLGLLHVPDEVFPLALLYLRIYLLGMPVILLYNFEAANFPQCGRDEDPSACSGGIRRPECHTESVFRHCTAHDCKWRSHCYCNLKRGQLSDSVPKTPDHNAGNPCGTPKPADRSHKPAPHSPDRPARRNPERGILRGKYRDSICHQQSGNHSHGSVQRSLQHRVFTYDILNSFSQACTTFVGQNFGAGNPQRCKKTLLLCLGEGICILGVAIAAILFWGKPLLSIFDSNPEVIETGYIRLMLVVSAHSFSLLYEVMAGYLRGFGISLAPAVITTICVCGIRFGWIQLIFPQNPTFWTIMTVYPVSLAATALAIFFALVYYRPARRFTAIQKNKTKNQPA